VIGMTVDSKGVMANLEKVESAIADGQEAGNLDIGWELMRLSQLEVPHDKGSLQNSGVVEPVGADVVVGYHEPYAARLHEHPEYRFQKGRKGKYLEDPIIKNTKALGIILVKVLKDNIGKVTK
jgi:hypothetical protein